MLGGVGSAIKGSESANNVTASSRTGLNVPKNTPGVQFDYHAVPPKGAGWGGQVPSEDENTPPSPEMVEEMKKMVRDANEGTVIEVLDEQKERNPKKRMMEHDKEEVRIRDEL